MEQQPLRSLSDRYTLERACAVCGEPSLAVVHVEDLPDYVNCGTCSSAFILSQDRDWVLYGSISEDYPQTRRMALKNWTTLEAVRTMASSERRPEREAVSAPTPPFGVGDASKGLDTGKQSSTPPFGFGEIKDIMDDSASGGGGLAPAEPLEEAADTAEPEPGSRYIVTLSSKNASFPSERCAHCLRRPAPKVLLISRGSDTYEIPLCQSCHRRASEGQEERRISKLVAHLSSILIAGLLIVGAIAIGLLDVQNFDGVDFLVLATLGMVGYGIPLIYLLGRTSKVPISDDAQFVRTTLRLREAGGFGYAWRNRGYSELFAADNEQLVVRKLVKETEP